MRGVATGACVAVVDGSAEGRTKGRSAAGAGAGRAVQQAQEQAEGGSEFILEPSASAIARSSSLHVFAYTPTGALILAESEGAFDIDEWERAADVARRRCIGAGADVEGGDVVMGGWDAREGGEALVAWLRSRVAGEMERGMRWKGGASTAASL